MSTRSAQEAKTLPAGYYTASEIFELEQERLFSNLWLAVGHTSQLSESGSYLVFQIGIESVLVVRNSTGELRAFHNVCRHRGSRLCTQESGHLPGKIQCPYHAWTYDLDGQLLGAPNMQEVSGFQRDDYPLHSVSLRCAEGVVFISFSEQPEHLESFESVQASLFERFARWQIPELRSVHRTQYDVDANWKLFFQNYSECYHCPTVHPLLNRLTPYRNSSNDLVEGPVLGGPMELSRADGSMSMDGSRCAAPLAELSARDHKLVYYYTIFPNMFLSLHPDYVLIHRSIPLAVDRTRIICEWFFHPDAIERADFDPSGALDFWDMTNRQDWELCERAQQGIASSGYTPGPYADLESQLAAFDRHYLEVLGH
ncbi:MAG: aromatic ring-hydroxylating dioxygenase subunit alpha [Thermoanaerobaculia bacterium]